jgi:hypothetical protein
MSAISFSITARCSSRFFGSLFLIDPLHDYEWRKRSPSDLPCCIVCFVLLRRDGLTADLMRLTIDSELSGPLDRRDCLRIGLAWWNGSTEVCTSVRMTGNKVKLNFLGVTEKPQLRKKMRKF